MSDMTTRRDFSKSLTAILISSVMTRVQKSRVGQRQASAGATDPQSTTVREVAGIQLVDSKLARAATDLCREASPPYLFNHSMRTFLFGVLIGRVNEQKFDAELLYLSCILHDLGLTSRFMGDMPFEIQGAEAAARFLMEHGLPKERAATVWDGITMHPYAMAYHKQPEIALVAAGAAADVVGSDLSLLRTGAKEEVLRAYPRLEFKNAFLKTCADVVRLHPHGAYRSFMRDIGERYVPEFHVPNICDAIKASFDE